MSNDPKDAVVDYSKLIKTNNIKIPAYHISWLQMAIENHMKSLNTVFSVVGSMTIDEYIKCWCAEDLKKVVDISG